MLNELVGKDKKKSKDERLKAEDFFSHRVNC